LSPLCESWKAAVTRVHAIVFIGALQRKKTFAVDSEIVGLPGRRQISLRQGELRPADPGPVAHGYPSGSSVDALVEQRREGGVLRLVAGRGDVGDIVGDGVHPALLGLDARYRCIKTSDHGVILLSVKDLNPDCRSG
jgi:hypothetical protein